MLPVFKFTRKSSIRSLVAKLVLPCIALFVPHSLYANTTSEVLLDANGEQLRGQVEDQIAVFRGIPFARPPVGDLRWREPKISIPRSGIQSALSFAPACMQTSYNTD